VSHLGESLQEYVLGTLPANEQAAAEAHVAACGSCAREAAAALEAFAALALAVEPLAPPAGARAALLAAATGASRFARFAEALGRLVDVGAEQASKLLDFIDNPAKWEAGPFAYLQLVHLEGGPAVAGADVGFIRVDAGTPFPKHTHLGEERVLVLQGAYRDEDGTVYRPGDTCAMPGGSAHSFQVLDGPPLIYALVLYQGVDFGDLNVTLK
jgi:predicted ChrR family anti-sigma factor